MNFPGSCVFGTFAATISSKVFLHNASFGELRRWIHGLSAPRRKTFKGRIQSDAPIWEVKWLNREWLNGADRKGLTRSAPPHVTYLQITHLSPQKIEGRIQSDSSGTGPFFCRSGFGVS